MSKALFFDLRKGSFSHNTALGGDSKGKGKGKKSAVVFPVLQVGSDPFSTLLQLVMCCSSCSQLVKSSHHFLRHVVGLFGDRRKKD